MAKAENEIRDYLQRAKQRDAGTRTTREVSDATGYSMSTVRKHLHAMHENGEIEAYDSGASGLMGNAIDWLLVHDRLSADPGCAPPIVPN